MITYEERITTSNAFKIFGGDVKWDLVMDGTDNAATRYLINDVCVKLGLPLVSGSALQWEGQITVLNYKGGPCYRCLYPQPPPAVAVTNCSDGGVIGMVPGIIGQMQAVEIVKIILEMPIENILWKRMIFFDALQMKFRNVKLRGQNLKCVICGPECEESLKLINVEEFDYQEFCQTKCSRYSLMKVPEENNITAQAFFEEISKGDAKIGLVDVRPKVQFEIVNTNASDKIAPHVKAINLQLRDLEKEKQYFEQNDKVFVMCRRGNKSKEATLHLLDNLNIKNVWNVAGGLEEIVK